MKNDLIVEKGKVVGIVGIENSTSRWEFLNEDPQICISFPEPIQGMRICFNTQKGSFDRGKFTVYYDYIGEGFCESQTYRNTFICGESYTFEILFQKSIHAVRFDPVDFPGFCEAFQISIKPITSRDILQPLFDNVIGDSGKNNEKLVILTHDLSETGAPILAYHLARGFQEREKEVIVIAGRRGNGFLEKKYEQSHIPIVFPNLEDNANYQYVKILEDNIKETMSDDIFFNKFLSKLAEGGYKHVIANTIVSGQYLPSLKKYGFHIISLIHEMKTSIERYDYVAMGNDVSKYADYSIFPVRKVEEDFHQLYFNVQGECLICPQGLYGEKSMPLEGAEMIQPLLSDMGIGDEDIVVMSSGVCCMRKGVDLFVSAAFILERIMTQKKVHFIWTGDFYEPELKTWLMYQCETGQLKSSFHFLPFVKDEKIYKQILQRADIFWALSREDPFPSTVLEAMDMKVPVVGFKGTGGIEDMLKEDRGILIEPFYLEELAERTKQLINDFDSEEMVERAKKYVDDMSFEKYIDFLDEILSS